MKERICTQQVSITMEGISKTFYLIMNDNGSFSIDYRYYKTTEEALQSAFELMNFGIREKCSKLHYNVKPLIYDVMDEKSRFRLAQRMILDSFPDEAAFLLDSFSEKTLKEIAMFLKDYCEDKCSKDFARISLLPRAKTNIKVMQTITFSKSEIISMTTEELCSKILDINLIGYMYL